MKRKIENHLIPSDENLKKQKIEIENKSNSQTKGDWWYNQTKLPNGKTSHLEFFICSSSEKRQILYKQFTWLESFQNHCLKLEKEVQIYLLPKNSLIIYSPCFLKGYNSIYNSLYEKLFEELDQLQMEQPIIYNYPTPREVLWQTEKKQAENYVNTNYTYSGQEQKSNEMTPKVKEFMNKIDEVLHLGLNSALINRYRKEKIYNKDGKWIQGAGKDSISAHRDKEEIFGKNPIILSLSLGQRRKFIIKYQGDTGCKKKPFVEFSLGQGDLLFMAGETNNYCTHEIPKECDLIVTEHRYNLTYRKIIL